MASLKDSEENSVAGGYVQQPYIGKGEIKFVIIGQAPYGEESEESGEDDLHFESV